MNETAIAVAWGACSKARGVIGAHLVLSEWSFDCEAHRYQFIKAKMVQVDGEKIKPEIWYKLEDGEIVEAEDD